MKRSDFDLWFPQDSPLRRTATEIATTDAQAYPNEDDKSRLDNFIANGQTGSAYQFPPPLPRDAPAWSALAQWKHGQELSQLSTWAKHGFADGTRSSPRGAALLFDPFVDAFLAAHMKHGGAIPKGCQVIILSDYYPLDAVSPAIPKGFQNDWGLEEMRNTLNGTSGKDLTTRKLFNCLFDENGWQGNPDRIAQIICDKHLLLWNFLPFFRGGDKAGGALGLPTKGPWRFYCWDFMKKFLEATQASRIVFACSEELLQKPLPCDKSDHAISILPFKSSQKFLRKPKGAEGFEAPPTLDQFPALPTCICEAFRLYHPRAWTNRKCQDQLALKKIIG